jgi:hypothetical protein
MPVVALPPELLPPEELPPEELEPPPGIAPPPVAPPPPQPIKRATSISTARIPNKWMNPPPANLLNPRTIVLTVLISSHTFLLFEIEHCNLYVKGLIL